MSPGLHGAVLWTCPPHRGAVSFTAQPGLSLSVSLAKAGQRGWAAKQHCTMAYVVRFPGNGLENSGAIVPGIIILPGPPWLQFAGPLERLKRYFTGL